MNNKDKLSEVFMVSFEIEASKVPTAVYRGIDLWDSVGHMTLISNIEEAFGIVIESKDIMSIKSFESAMQILSTNYNIKF